MDYQPRLIELDFVVTLYGTDFFLLYVCMYSYTFSFLAMPTTDYCVDQICGHMLVQGFTYLSLFVVHIHHNHDGLLSVLSMILFVPPTMQLRVKRCKVDYYPTINLDHFILT